MNKQMFLPQRWPSTNAENAPVSEKEPWRKTEYGIDWRDGGIIELRSEDGNIVQRRLIIEEWFSGEEDIAMPLLEPDDISFFDFVEWRHVK